MGRPIKKKFFGNTNPQGVGGQGIASVSVTTGGTGYAANATITFPAPTVPGGATATGALTVVGGVVTAVKIVKAGSGYTTAPTPTFSVTTGTAAVVVVALTATRVTSIAATAFVLKGSSEVLADIVKQEASHRYLVKTAQGTSQCKLVSTAVLVAGQMHIIATDVQGSTYFVTKLTAKRVILTQKTAAGTGFQFVSGRAAKWTLNGASTGIVSITHTN